MQYLPYRGTYKQIKTNNAVDEIDEYEIMALCKRLNITVEDMKEMSFVSLINILISSVEEKKTTRKATKEDIAKFIGG